MIIILIRNFAHLLFFLSSCWFRKPKFTVLDWQGQIHVTGWDSTVWRYLRLLNQAPKYELEPTEDQCSDGT